MKSIIRLTFSIFLFYLWSFGKNVVESAAILPTLPDQHVIPFATTRVSNYYANVVYNQTNTIISDLNPLQNELSYNCLSGNFRLGLHLNNVTTAQASYSFKGLVDTILGAVQMTASGQVSLFCTNQEDDRCLMTASGQIVEEEDENGVKKLVTKNLAVYLPTTATVDDGTVDELPIGDAGDYFVSLAQTVASDGAIQTTVAHLEAFISDVVFMNMTMDDLVTLTHGTCVDSNGRSAIIPDLPSDYEFDQVTLYRIDSFNNISFEHHRTFSELTDMKHDFTYNCMTNTFEITVLASANISAHGLFVLDGSYGYDQRTNFTATGIMIETCPVRDEDQKVEENPCLVTASGYIRKNETSDGVVASTFGMFWPAKIEFQVESAMVNDHDWQEDQESIDVITKQLNDWTYDDRNRFYDILEARLNQLLENTTMAQLISMTGGACDV